MKTRPKLYRNRYITNEDGTTTIIDRKGNRYLVDTEDIERCNLKYYYWQSSTYGYAQATRDKKTILLHRLIMNNPPKGYDVHHVNCIPTDDRKANLRVVTHSENIKHSINYIGEES